MKSTPIYDRRHSGDKRLRDFGGEEETLHTHSTFP